MNGQSGVLPVLKPPGPSSHQVVQVVRHAFGRGTRVGHAGTLDPEAAGVLPVCVGTATRLAEYLQIPPKVYRFELILGVATDTNDATGRVVAVGDAVGLSEECVTAALTAFRGRIVQKAPMYSARHHDGKRLYEIAREGGEAPRPEFQVVIWDLRLLSWAPDPPVALCEVSCGSGTYVRALCDDLGRHLGCGAHMGALLRRSAGGISASECWTLEEITAAARGGEAGGLLLTGAQALQFLPKVMVDDLETTALLNGRAPGRRRQAGPDGVETVCLVDVHGRLLAVATRHTQAGVAAFVLEKVLAAGGREAGGRGVTGAG